MTTFAQLGLSEALVQILEKEGYVTPTPIQAQAIPLLLEGHDLQGIAQTGTGKTAAFALPILHKLLANRVVPMPGTCRVLVLSPTRELASQIAESFKTYARGMRLSIATVYGGVKYGPQIKAIQGGLDILVATPGRLLDHVSERIIDLSRTEFLVLDEADQMLDLGFVKPIRQIASRLAKVRQNLFFSATMPKEINDLAAELLTDPKRVTVTPVSSTAERVVQSVIFVEQNRKRAMLSELYSDDSYERTLVFTRTKRSADRVAAYLQAGAIEAAAIHGDKSQGQRERALQAFRDGRVRALVATDIAARGIDVDGVTHVINFELPQVAEAYVHRIGRTARAGKSGIAVTLCSDDERRLLRDIQKVTRLTLPTFDRRKDKALAALDAAILAAGPAEKPTTPDRVRTDRHSDPDAERVHKRSRKRPSRDGGPEQRSRPPRENRYAGFEEGGEARAEGGGFRARDSKPAGRGYSRSDQRPAQRSEHRPAQRPVYDPLAVDRAGFDSRPAAKPRPDRFERGPDRGPDRGERTSDRGSSRGGYAGDKFASDRAGRPGRGPRPDGRFEGRSEGRAEGRPDYRSEPRGEGRKDTRHEGRHEGRPARAFGDKPAPRAREGQAPRNAQAPRDAQAPRAEGGFKRRGGRGQGGGMNRSNG